MIHTQATITDYLQTLLSTELQLPKAILNPSSGFARFGLNSIKAVELSEKIATHYGITLEPTVFLDYESIETLAAHLHTLCTP